MDNREIKSNAGDFESITQRVFDRLNQHLQDDDADLASRDKNDARSLLQQLGNHLRVWRLGQNYSRQDCAERLGTEIDLLLCLEQGIAQPEDISKEFLFSLRSHVEASQQDSELTPLINQYLSLL